MSKDHAGIAAPFIFYSSIAQLVLHISVLLQHDLSLRHDLSPCLVYCLDRGLSKKTIAACSSWSCVKSDYAGTE